MYKFTRWVPYDRSGKVCWLLNELDLPYEVEDLDYSKHHNDEDYRKIHPLGQVPALTDLREGFSMFESGAICLYLAGRHSEGEMLPSDPVARARVYQWSLYNYATLEPVFMEYWNADASAPDLEQKKKAIDEKMIKLFAPIEDALRSHDYVAGDKFSVADVIIGNAAFWISNRPIIEDLPRTKQYLERIKNRPAVIKSEIFCEQP
jgi:glutathione S-transferase